MGRPRGSEVNHGISNRFVFPFIGFGVFPVTRTLVGHRERDREQRIRGAIPLMFKCIFHNVFLVLVSRLRDQSSSSWLKGKRNDLLDKSCDKLFKRGFILFSSPDWSFIHSLNWWSVEHLHSVALFWAAAAVEFFYKFYEYHEGCPAGRVVLAV